MRLQTAQAMLDQIRMFRHSASRFSARLAEFSQDKKRLGLMLDHLAAHEEQLADIMLQHEEDFKAGCVELWPQDLPGVDLLGVLGGMEAPGQASPDVDDLLRLGMHLDDYLIWCLEKLAHQAGTQESREIFESLLRLARSDKHSLARDTLARAGTESGGAGDVGI